MLPVWSHRCLTVELAFCSPCRQRASSGDQLILHSRQNPSGEQNTAIFTMLRQLLRPFARNVAQRGERAYHAPTHFKRATMDELPIPQGSWQQYYDSKQKTYNMQLAAGVVFFVGTMAYIVNTGAIYLNWAPPSPKDVKK